MCKYEAKLEAIKKAYGDYYAEIKEFINKSGWLNSNKWLGSGGNTMIYSKIKDIKLECLNNYDKEKCYYFRPKSLQGIDNNNGWIKIEDSLPIIEPDKPYQQAISFWVQYVNYKNEIEIDRMVFFSESQKFEVSTVTHWQPIIKPKPPIY